MIITLEWNRCLTVSAGKMKALRARPQLHCSSKTFLVSVLDAAKTAVSRAEVVPVAELVLGTNAGKLPTEYTAKVNLCGQDTLRIITDGIKDIVILSKGQSKRKELASDIGKVV